MAGSSLNPFDGIDVGLSPKAMCFNMDADQDIDCLFGNADGTFKYFKNTRCNPTCSDVKVTKPTFTAATSPFDGIDVGNNAAPFCFNIAGGNNNMDFECIVGNADGKIYYYRNTAGTPVAPVYVRSTDAENLFNGVDVGSFAAPTCFDVDGDMDYDCFVGNGDGVIKAFMNIGSFASPVYNETIGADNPFSAVDVGSKASMTCIDMDSDGDIDCLIGNSEGKILYFKKLQFLSYLDMHVVLK